MSPLILLGQPDTKRTIFLKKALEETGLSLTLLPWDLHEPGGMGIQGPTGFPEARLRELPSLSRCFIKIDPPVWSHVSLKELGTLTAGYGESLHRLQSLPAGAWLNQPDQILALLDKRGCKKMLRQAGLPVTEELTGFESDPPSLFEAMKARHMTQIFLKPVYGSGAAGVTALRLHPHTGQLLAYSCALPLPEAEGGLVNTKRLRLFRGTQEVIPLLKALLPLGCIAERWYAKADFQGCSYDLRAVCQRGQIDFLLARLSKGPVTNLHLNNHPLPASRLMLPPALTEEIRDLCLRAMSCYPGLSSAGIDILLEKGTLKPRIIEMNGQGDLIYEDIYHHNRIYLHQAQMMKEWTERQVSYHA